MRIVKLLIEYLWPNRVYTSKNGISEGLKLKGGFHFIKRKIYNSKEIKILKSLDYKNQIIFDVGANVRHSTIFFAKSVSPNGKVNADQAKEGHIFCS